MAQDVRLQKWLADCGVASRRKAELLIEAGRVTVNGVRASLGDKLDPDRDVVALDGAPVAHQPEKIYLMLHKPRGYLSAASDDRGRRCVTELVADLGVRLYPVGRLDKDSEGLLLMTNDGAFAQRIAHPGAGVEKVYRVTVRPNLSEEQLTALTVGVELEDGPAVPKAVRVLEQQGGRVVLEFVLTEGKNREIRRMCEAVGLKVARLKRTSVGGVKLGMLPLGKYRMLTPAEVKQLMAASSGGKKRTAQTKAPEKQKPTGRGTTVGQSRNRTEERNDAGNSTHGRPRRRGCPAAGARRGR